ncbi:Cytochrome C biogenesis protein [uncultured archaeon]|nr:Cytochrome C biogenesis protein [uncultured archaeon]
MIFQKLRGDPRLCSMMSLRMKEKMYRVLMLFALLTSGINIVQADNDMTSDLICPCECVMVISTCDCPTAIQVNEEIVQMKQNGFSEMQIFSALQAEYGKEILPPPEKTNAMLLWMGGASLSILFVFLGYIFTKKLKKEVIPDIKNYEQKFEEEYLKFVSEMEGK